MGAATSKPHQVIGMHFFNPAHVMKLVEIIPGLDTSQETVDDVERFVMSLRKVPVRVQECPGFLVNRLLIPYLNEAAFCLEEGAAAASEIDQAMVKWGWPMGPFTLMDMLGLDVCVHVGDYLAVEYGDRMAPTLIMPHLVEMGRLGEKSAAGFYGYGDQTDEPTLKLIDEIRAEKGVTDSEFSPERLVYLLINEATLCMQENVASVNDIDMAMIAGAGMTYGGERMGPLAVADRVGLDVVLEGLQALEARYGLRFRPSRLLKLKVRAGHLGNKAGKGFYEYTE
jgi:3-hydroxyacyl-CoA dehydrogenase/enoyl-CoA hydratase/3-hydroxybutyryl-CoA epimerase